MITCSVWSRLPSKHETGFLWVTRLRYIYASEHNTSAFDTDAG